MIVKGDDGLVIIDSGMTMGAAEKMLSEFRKITGQARQSDHLHAWAWQSYGPYGSCDGP
jgi:hypothetical protein